MRRLDQLDREQQALCLGARTTLDQEAASALRTLAGGALDWDRLWDLGHLHDVLPLLAVSLPAAAGEAVPDEWLARARRRRHVTLRRNGRLAEELIRVLDALDTAGIPVLPVKGLVVAEQLYGSLAARPAADVDVLVRTGDLDAGRGVLRDLGYRQRPVPSSKALMHEFHDPAWFVGSGSDQVRLELHWALWAYGFFHLGTDGLWERAVPGTLLGRPVHLLSPEDTLLHLAIHRTRSPLRLRWICDVAELVRHHAQTLDWDAVSDRARLAGARTATWMVLALADRLLGASPPAEVLERLRVGSAKAALLERTCGVAAVFRPASPGDLEQQPHLTLRVFEQDGGGQIARALASSLGRMARRGLHDAGVVRIRRRPT